MKLNNLRNVEVDWPVLNKFLFCLPLRPGLILWGYLQLVAVIIISGYAIIEFSERAQNRHGAALVQLVVLFIFNMIASLIEVINCFFLVLGAQMKNANFLEVSYHYLKVKIPVFAVLLIISFVMKIFAFSDWDHYMYDLDSWRYTTLMDNQALGVIDIALQFYLLLLVRSEIIKLEHTINWTSLYERIYNQPIPAGSLDSKPKLEII